MRLTLRTLLAYLDGVLPAADREDLALRVNASAVAQSLVARIRQVTGQAAIGAPRADGRGLGDDPNSVAEYLDNTLDPVRLEMFERICLESNMHLAEAASCHAILAEVARDPAAMHDLDDADRRRLLRAVRQRLAPLAARVELEEARANAQIVRAAVQSAADEPDTIFSTDTPTAVAPRQKAGGRSSWVAWASAASAIVLLVALGGVLVWSVTSRGSRASVKPPRGTVADADADATAPRTVAVAQPAPPSAAPSASESAPEPVPPAPPAPEPALAAERREEPPEPAAAASPSAESPAPPPPAAAAAPPPLVPSGRALAIAAPPAAPAPPVVPPSAVAPAAASAAADGFVGGAGLVLRHVADADWAVLPAFAALPARDRLVAAPGFHPEITVGGVVIHLFPGTEVCTSLDDDGTPRLELIRGRMVARASRGDARLGITAAALAGTVTAGLTAPIAAVVDVDRAAGADPAVSLPRVRAELFTTSGPIGWRQQTAAATPPLEGIAAEGMLEARSAIVWESGRPTLVAIVDRATLPGWVTAPPGVDAVEKRASEALAAKAISVQPLLRGLRELTADRRAENRVAAGATLALLGEYDDLVALLCAEEPGRRLEARQWAALEGQGVPLALTRGADHAAALRRAFATHAPDGTGELLATLACGFDDDALAAGGDRTLVEALDDPALVVRRYAIKNIVDIVQPAATDRLRYRADGVPDLRREGIDWWRGQLEKGLIRRPISR